MPRTDALMLGYTDFVGPFGAEAVLVATDSYTISGVINGKPYSFTYNLVGWKLAFDDTGIAEGGTVGLTVPTVLLGGAQVAWPVYAASGGSPTGMKKITVKDNPVAGAGGFLMADLNVGSVKTEYWVPEGGSIPNHSVSYLAWAHPGYMCSEIRMNGQLGLGGFVGGTLVPSTSGTADFVQMAKLTVNIESTGGDPSGAKPECMGYYTLSPASYYYTPDLPAMGPIPAREGERVTVTAIARPGYSFVKWAGVGKAIVGGQEEAVDKDCTLNPVTVVMHGSRELTAVFEMAGGRITIYVEKPISDGMCGDLDAFDVGHTFFKLSSDSDCRPPEFQAATHYICPAAEYICPSTMSKEDCDQRQTELRNRYPNGIRPKQIDGKFGCPVGLLNHNIGFYPQGKIDGSGRANPSFHIPDVHSSIRKHQYKITYAGLLGALNYLKVKIDTTDEYNVASPNCTTVALEIAAAAGISGGCMSAICPKELYECFVDTYTNERDRQE